MMLRPRLPIRAPRVDRFRLGTAGAHDAAPRGSRARADGRGGFTLIELVVALTILGLLAATLYLSLGGSLKAVERVSERQEPYQRGRVARTFLTSALRSAAPFAGLPGDGFVAVDSTAGGAPRDELTFVAFAPPGSVSSRMQLHLFVGDSVGSPTLRLAVRPVMPGDSLPPFRTYTLSKGVAGLDIEYLAAPADERVRWTESWESQIRLPYALRISFIPSTTPDPAYRVPLLVQIPAGRTL